MKLKCNLCPRNCDALRDENNNTGGYCGMPLTAKIAHADLHFWEEPCISGKNGSGTVFFSGCTLRCVYCQNYRISHGQAGRFVSAEQLAAIFKDLEERGAHNINFVNPTHYIGAVKQALDIYRPKIPLVCNSGGYDRESVIRENIFDIYLLDLKYLSSDKALKYSGAADYPEVAVKAIKAAYAMTGKPTYDKNGIMQRGLIVRHLVLPQSTREAISVAEWFKNNTPDAVLSIMAQYIPVYRAGEFPEINRRITAREYEKVLNSIMELDIENVYIQQPDSASEQYIPHFNMIEN